jgi:hypothetical protein
MNAMNTLTKNEGPTFHEVETSEVRAVAGGRVEVYEPVSYPAAGTPWPTPWRAIGYPVPDPWLAAGSQQYVIGI